MLVDANGLKFLFISVPSPPSVKISPFNSVGLAGQTYRLTCLVIPPNGINRTISVMWTRDGMALPSGESSGSIINIRSLSTSHGGRYTCSARLTIPEAGVDVSGENTTSIIVQSKLHLNSPRPGLHEG